MSVQFRPITGREDGDWFDEEEPFRIPPSYMLVDNGLVWAWSPNGCYRCSFRYLESAMVFTFLDRWGYRHDRIVAWNVLDDMGFLSRAFKIQIGRELSVRTNYSKLMGGKLPGRQLFTLRRHPGSQLHHQRLPRQGRRILQPAIRFDPHPGQKAPAPHPGQAGNVPVGVRGPVHARCPRTQARGGPAVPFPPGPHVTESFAMEPSGKTIRP